MRRRQPAQALVWFVVMLPFVLAVIGLAIDGETVLRAHRRAQGAADGAARAGAGQIDLDYARRFSAGPARLDPQAAEQAALAYVRHVYPDLQATVNADDRVVVVHVQRQVAPAFLQLLQVQSVPVAARAHASPRSGIDRPMETE